MEKAREVVTTRARYQAQVVAFVAKNVSGLERRIARHGESSLFNNVLEMLGNPRAASVVDGKLVMTADTMRDWSLDDDCLRMLNDTYYLPMEGRMDDVLQCANEVLVMCQRIIAIVPQLRNLFSDEGRHSAPMTQSKALHFVQHYSPILEWAENLCKGRHADRIEASWYYLWPRYDTTLEQHKAVCAEICDAMFGLSMEDTANCSRFTLYNRTPMYRLSQHLHRASGSDVELSHAGFPCSGKITERVFRILNEFCVLTNEQRLKVHRTMSAGRALLHSSGQHIVCYANERDYDRGRCSIMPIARWLRSFGEVDDAGVQKVVNAMRVSKIEYLKDYADWLKAYTGSRDMGSCMAYESQHFEVFDDDVPCAPGSSLLLHPVWCYADHEHVRIAVIKRGDDMVARAIVNTQSKQFYRVYGDYALHAALTMDGYEENDEFLCGVTLRSVLVHGKHLLHPYVDGRYSEADVVVHTDDDVEMHLSYSGEFDLQNTEGGRRYFSQPTAYCMVCDSHHHDGDDLEVIDGDGDTIYEVCRSCANGTVYAYDEDDRRHHNVLESGTERCAISGDLYIRSALVYSEYHDNLVAPSELRKWEEELEEAEEEEE